VRILQLDPATLAALADGDIDRANETSPTPLSPYFACEQWRGTWRYRVRQIAQDPSSLPWITGVVVDADSGLAVGRAGFHGPPDSAGMVEVGYAVAPIHRRRGYARSALATMLVRAVADPLVRRVRASISPSNWASRHLVAEFGFVEVGDQWDDEDGLEIVYEILVDTGAP
jgi:RimJ/RimL family protein N-acetyltransferase